MPKPDDHEWLPAEAIGGIGAYIVETPEDVAEVSDKLRQATSIEEWKSILAAYTRPATGED